LQQGSNGSSAGSASATVAGLTFAIGTETYGSIVAPSAVQQVASNIWQCCPNWGHEPAWTSDRIGPIAAALKIVQWYSLPHGSDTYDRASRTMPFNYTDKIELKT
jgi:Asp-tRNA(Asn)/Glu-tRNA(Gln) amidotransferase A subunit family amidase